MKVKSAVLAVIVACTTGCSAVVRPSAAEITNTKHVEDKNYALGVSAEAHVGDAMVRVRDYFVTRRTAPTAAPSADMVISGGPVTIPLTTIKGVGDKCESFALSIVTDPISGGQ